MVDECERCKGVHEDVLKYLAEHQHGSLKALGVRAYLSGGFDPHVIESYFTRNERRMLRSLVFAYPDLAEYDVLAPDEDDDLARNFVHRTMVGLNTHLRDCDIPARAKIVEGLGYRLVRVNEYERPIRLPSKLRVGSGLS